MARRPHKGTHASSSVATSSLGVEAVHACLVVGLGWGREGLPPRVDVDTLTSTAHHHQGKKKGTWAGVLREGRGKGGNSFLLGRAAVLATLKHEDVLSSKESLDRLGLTWICLEVLLESAFVVAHIWNAVAILFEVQFYVGSGSQQPALLAP